MDSSRTVSGECGNEENKQGQDLSDGVTNVYVTGREFEDIYPVWNWRRLPGTIEVQTPVRPPGTGSTACDAFIDDLHAHQRTPFVGGASDGSVGITVMDYRSRGELQVRRTWFMFGGVVIVSNTGSTTLPTENPVATSLDQRLVNGRATYAERTATAPYTTPPLQFGPGPGLATSSLAFLHHSSIGYVPLPTPRMVAGGAAPPRYTVMAKMENKTGSWENITQGDESPVTKPVFTAYIDHGMAEHPLDVSSVYAIIPGVSAAGMPAALDELDAHLSVQSGWNASSACLVGSPAGQQVRHRLLLGSSTPATTTMMAALWHPTAARAEAAAAGCWDIAVVSLEPPAFARPRTGSEHGCAGATPPMQDMHCDLEKSTALSSAPSANVTDCAAACCAQLNCTCWTWTKNESGKGPYCMLKASRAPLVPAERLYGGTIPTRASARPTGVVVVVNRNSAPASVSAALHLHVADPSAQLTSATIEISGSWEGGCVPSPLRKNTSLVNVALPGGDLAGSTVHVHCTPTADAAAGFPSDLFGPVSVADEQKNKNTSL